jgi:hypothetical protein
MADEGDDLHDAWAPPPEGTSADPDPAEPTQVMATEPLDDALVVPSPPPAEPPMPPEVVPAADEIAPPRRRWPGSAKAIVVILAILLLATAAGLGYGWWKTSNDKKDLETASNQQGTELSQQLDKANKDLAATQEELTTANGKVTDLQGQLTTAQADAAAAKEQSEALAGLFPLTAQKLQPGLPGTYRSDSVTVLAGGCSLPACPPVQLTLTIEASGSALTVSDPVLGRLPLALVGSGWTATGPAPAAFQLPCNGVLQPTTFTLTVGASTIALDANDAPQVASLGGGFLLSSAAVAATTEPVNPGCPVGVGIYLLGANRT